jgi:hypothetical protein
MGDKKRDTTKEEAKRILTILFQKTQHDSYFAKLPFGSKANFEKMSNAILPLVMLTWLRQLQEYFFEISDSKESGDWNDHGKYFAVRASHVTKEFPLDSVHMMKANSTTLVKVDSFAYIKPDNRHNKKVIKSLEEWASKILCRENNDYVRNIAKSDEETKKRFKRTEKHGTTQYSMSNTSYKPNDDHTGDSVDIKRYTAAQQRSKSEEQLFLHVSKYKKDEIKALQKKADKTNPNQKDIMLLNRANETAAHLVEIYNRTTNSELSTIDKMDEHLKSIKIKEKKIDSECSEEGSEYDDDDE